MVFSLLFSGDLLLNWHVQVSGAKATIAQFSDG